MKEKRTYLLSLLLLIILQMSLLTLVITTVKMHDSSTEQTITYIKELDLCEAEISKMINVETETNHRNNIALFGLSILFSIVIFFSIFVIGEQHRRFLSINIDIKHTE